MEPININKIFLLLIITVVILLNGCGAAKKEPCMPIVLMQSVEYMQETTVSNPVIYNNGDILKRNNELYEALKLCNDDKAKLREERDNLINKLNDSITKK